MPYDYNDAIEEAFYRRQEAEFRRLHSDTIADEVTNGEIIDAVLVAHREWAVRVSESLVRARRRFEQGEFAESLFHAGRAFDGYVLNVMVLPLKGTVVGRFARFMPANLPMRAADIFKHTSGFSSALGFAEYTASLTSRVQADAQWLIEELRSLANGGNGLPNWDSRNRAFHAPIEVPEAEARALLERVERVSSVFIQNADRLIEQQRRELEVQEFSAARIEALHWLARGYDADPQASVRVSQIAQSLDAIEDQATTFHALHDLGYIEMVPNPQHARGQPTYRLTQQGRAYYQDEIIPRLPGALLAEYQGRKGNGQP
jgi:hypothetical protein